MIRYLLIIFLLTGLAVWGERQLEGEAGYVLLHIGPWIVETTLVALLLGLIGFLLVAYVLYNLLRTVLRMPSEVKGAWQRRKREKAQKALTDGLLRLSEGRWEQAELSLVQRVSDLGMPVLSYLGAAQAAQRLQADDRRDQYLELALQSAPEAEVAVLLTQAQLQLQQGRDEDALATLVRARELDPDNQRALELLIDLRATSNDWQALNDLLRQAARARFLSTERAHELAVQVACQRLTAAGSETDTDDLLHAWSDTPKRLRDLPSVTRAYVTRLRECGADSRAGDQILQFMKRHWDDELAKVYGELDQDDSVAQLATVEEWVQRHGDKPILLVLAGQLCLRNKLWGRARSYLERSLAQGPNPETYLALGELSEQTEDVDAALINYRAGLALSQSSSLGSRTKFAPVSAISG